MTPPASPDPGVRQAELNRSVAGNWEMFADQLGGATYLHGVAPGALDLFAAVVSRGAGPRTHLDEHRPAFHALLKRIDSHPQLAPVFKRHWDT